MAVDIVTFVTGVPGSGKTLWMIDYARRLSEASQRPVYQWGIDGLAESLDWTAIERAEEWYTVPAGSIVLIDEAWKVFPTAPAGAAVPRHVSEFAELRHRGLSVFMTTQHVTQIHTFPRKMCTHHVHVKRVFGSQRATVYEWAELGEPNDYHSRQKAIAKVWAYPREVFGLYKSAEIHTVKASVPWRKLAIIPLGVVAIGTLGFTAFSVLDPRAEDELEVDGGPTAGGAPAAAPGPAAQRLVLAGDSEPGPAGRAGLYDLETWQPEVAGLDYTARFYDGLIEPASFPKIDGCMSLEVDGELTVCRCNSQQGTRLAMPVAQCRYYVDAGWYDFSMSDAEAEARRQPPPEAQPSEAGAPGGDGF